VTQKDAKDAADNNLKRLSKFSDVTKERCFSFPEIAKSFYAKN
jgi:hypothetical protein